MPGRAITQVCPQCQMPLVLPASFAGRTVPCTRCGHSVVVSGAAAAPLLPPAVSGAKPVGPPHLAARLAAPPEPAGPPGPQPPSPLPPHLVQKGIATSPMLPVSAVAAEPAEEELADEAPQPRSCFLTGCLMVSVASIVISGALGAVLLTVWMVRRWQATHVATSGGDPAETPHVKNINKKEYTDASRRAATISGVTARIDRVEVGKVDHRSKGEILQTATPNYLIVSINVKNKSRAEPVEYQSWYDNKFENDAGEQQDVELIDDNGLELKVFPLPGAESVERHNEKSSCTLPQGDDITDSLVFKLPDGYIDEPIPPLYLKLPVAAVGDRGYFRFHIPTTLVVRRDK